MGMHEYSQGKSGGAPVQPIPGGSTRTGSAEDEAEKESEQGEEPEKGFGKAMKLHHERQADHHDRKAELHDAMADHHRDEAEYHRKEGAKY